METKTFTVNGMKCNHCKASVEQALQGVKGVKSAKVSLADKNATVEYDETQTTPQNLKDAVDGLGRFELVL